MKVRADHRRSARACPQRKTKAKNEQAKTATLEEVIEALEAAFEAVRANKGAPGPDRQGIEQVREHWSEIKPQLAQSLLAHIRRRLRAMEIKQCKRKRTIVKKLIQRGIRAKTARRQVYEGRKSIWALSHTWAVDRALTNSLWEDRGLKSLTQRYGQHPARRVARGAVQHELVFG